MPRKTKVVRIDQTSYLKLDAMADDLGQRRNELLDVAVALLYQLYQQGKLPTLKRKRWIYLKGDTK